MRIEENIEVIFSCIQSGNFQEAYDEVVGTSKTKETMYKIIDIVSEKETLFVPVYSFFLYLIGVYEKSELQIIVADLWTIACADYKDAALYHMAHVRRALFLSPYSTEGFIRLIIAFIDNDGSYMDLVYNEKYLTNKMIDNIIKNIM